MVTMLHMMVVAIRWLVLVMVVGFCKKKKPGFNSSSAVRLFSSSGRTKRY